MWYLPSPIYEDLAVRIRDALVFVGITWEISDVERCRPFLRSAIRMTHPDKAVAREDPHTSVSWSARGEPFAFRLALPEEFQAKEPNRLRRRNEGWPFGDSFAGTSFAPNMLAPSLSGRFLAKPAMRSAA